MFLVNKACNVCLGSPIIWKLVTDTDSKDISFMFKLNFVVPEIEWIATNVICSTCIEDLNAAHKFKEHSLISHKLLQVEDSKDIIAHANEIQEQTIISPDIENENERGLLENGQNTQVVSFICYNCDKVFKGKNEMKVHILNNHQKQKCKKCGYICEDKAQLKVHENQEHNQTLNQKNTKPYLHCNDCTENFVSRIKLIKHSVDVHKRDKNTVRPFECDVCQKRFKEAYKLERHKGYHTKSRNHICTYCGKGFITTSDLKSHEKRHLNLRNYRCKICSKSFNTNQNLATHRMVKHTKPEEWHYHCSFCDRKFPTSSNYNMHMRRHMGIKKFNCHLCEKMFISRSEMTEHSETHSNIKLFKCNDCGKEYKKNRSLVVHLKKEHNIGDIVIPIRVRKHVCKFCPKAFQDKGKLARHQSVHSNKNTAKQDCEKFNQ